MDSQISRLLTEVDVEALLDVVRSRVGMDLAWVSSFTDQTQVFEVLAGNSAAFGLDAGDHLDLDGSFCTRVVDGRLPNIIDDAASHAVTSALSVTGALGIGSYIGVPIRGADEAPTGMLCCISRTSAPHLVEADVRTLKVFASVLAELMRQADTLDGVRRERDRLTAEIHADISAGRVRMVFQPIVDCAAGRPVGVEALCRIENSSRRPDEWFEMASSVGMRARAELAAIAAAIGHLDFLPEPLYMSLNASPETIADPDLLELMDCVDAQRIVMEITEHHRIDEYPVFLTQLDQLRSRGIRIAVDDVGAGFSSFAHVLELDPDIIKLDRSIVAGIDSDLARQAITRAVVDLGRHRDATVVAEGVENVDELRAISLLGIHVAQGYFFRRPGPLGDILDVARADVDLVGDL